jgi:hypothetical protein
MHSVWLLKQFTNFVASVDESAVHMTPGRHVKVPVCIHFAETQKLCWILLFAVLMDLWQNRMPGNVVVHLILHLWHKMHLRLMQVRSISHLLRQNSIMNAYSKYLCFNWKTVDFHFSIGRKWEIGWKVTFLYILDELG